MKSEQSVFKESHLRSIVKALSWRLLATLTTIFIAGLITGDVEIALAIGGIEFFAKFFIYYAHERVWQLVPNGKSQRPEGSGKPGRGIWV